MTNDVITIDIEFDVAKAIAQKAIKHDASRTIMNEYIQHVESTGDFDLTEFTSILGSAIVNDFVLDALTDMMHRERTKLVVDVLNRELKLHEARLNFLEGEYAESLTDEERKNVRLKSEFAVETLNLALREVESKGIN